MHFYSDWCFKYLIVMILQQQITKAMLKSQIIHFHYGSVTQSFKKKVHNVSERKINDKLNK